MKLNSWLNTSTNRLKNSEVGTPELDSLVILEDVTGKDRGWLLAHPEFELTSAQIAKLNTKIARRAKHEPLAYIRGFTEFYGRRFKVNKDVLEPRPESETMIDLLLDLASSEPPTANRFSVIDIGTGSGALAITAKLELPKTEVIATDIDPNCLKIARLNAAMHQVDIKFYEGDLLQISNLRSQIFDLVLANLPYVPDHWQTRPVRDKNSANSGGSSRISNGINQAAAHEPKSAIFGGEDGLDLYRRLFDQLKHLKKPPRYVLTESLPPQHQKLAKIALKNDYKQLKSQDFIQLFETKLP